MKSFCFCLCVWLVLLLVTAHSASSSSGGRRKSKSNNDAVRARPWRFLETPRGGGTGCGDPNLPFDVDAVAGFLKAGKTVFVKDVAPVLARESKKGLKLAEAFIKEQKKKAAQRRAEYRRNAKKLSATASTLVDPLRAVKLTVAAFILAEAINFLDSQEESALFFDDFSQGAKGVASDVGVKFDNFVKVGREPGGLLRGETWTSRQKWFAGIQKQVTPKYQWAMGAAVGFVASPIVWSLGWASLGCTMVACVVAETHHTAKKHFSRYFDFLVSTNNQVIFVVDGFLEDLRDLVTNIVEQPKATLFAIRNELDERIDLDFEVPLDLQRGLMFGAVVGVVAGA